MAGKPLIASLLEKKQYSYGHTTMLTHT